MAQRLLECVPNFSEGRNSKKIDKIAATIASHSGVRLLNVDVGHAANRTVMTFMGEEEAVLQAAFDSVQCAQSLIDMRSHSGEHPRLGATDVLPLIPLEGVTMSQCVEAARTLAQRISSDLGIPTYCYQHAAFYEHRRNLAVCRKGEYEALHQRLISVDDAPDYGARPMDLTIERSGATNVGARDFLIAVNFTLDTCSVEIANNIARQVRQSGYLQRNADGSCSRVHGLLPECKAIGWYIKEYGAAQVSMNLTNIAVTPLHTAYQAVCALAQSVGVQVVATEIIGMIPRRVLLEAAHYYNFSADNPTQAMTMAIEKMQLNAVHPFHVETKSF